LINIDSCLNAGVFLYNLVMLLLLVIVIFYLYAIAPNTKRKLQQKPFEEVYLAHRGLFNNVDIPENSLAAFKLAVDNEYGMELDVQLTTDKKLVVFHDASLKRICGIDKKLTDCSYEELQQYSLLNTNHKIPLFIDVLDVLKETTPLVIEIKAEGPYIETTKAVVELMKTYKRTYSMESFNPNVVYYLRKNHPEIIRGQLSYNYLKDSNSKINIFLKIGLTYLLSNIITRPDYIAYDVNNMHNLSFRLISKLYKGECVAWTVKSEESLNKAKKYYQCFIFDSFIPAR